MINNLITETLNLREFEFLNEKSEITNTIDKMSKVNIFVGANNSGKSRLLRKIAKADEYKSQYSVQEYEELKLIASDFKEKINGFIKKLNLQNDEKTKYLEYELGNDSQLWNINNQFSSNDIASIIHLSGELACLELDNSKILMYVDVMDENHKIRLEKNDRIRKLNEIGQEFFDKFVKYPYKFDYYNRVYFPVLRGLRGFYIYLCDVLDRELLGVISPEGFESNNERKILENIYKRRTEKDYFQNQSYELRYGDIINWNSLLIRDKMTIDLLKNELKEIEPSLYFKSGKGFLNRRLTELIINRIDGFCLSHRTNDPLKNFKKKEIKENKHFDRQIGIERDNYRYNRKIIEAIFPDEIRRAGVEIITGLDFYDEIRDMLLGTQGERDIIRAFENFLSEIIFEGQSCTAPRLSRQISC